MNTELEKHIAELQQRAFQRGFQDGWKAVSTRVNGALEVPSTAVMKCDQGFASAGTNPFRSSSGQAKVYNYIRDNPGKSVKSIATDTGLTSKIVSNTVYRLRANNLAVDDDGWRLL